MQYLFRICLAISILINVITGGPSNQACSDRNYGWKREGKRNLVWIIDTFCYYVGYGLTRMGFPCDYRNHCMSSWCYWRARKDVAHEFEVRREYESKKLYKPVFIGCDWYDSNSIGCKTKTISRKRGA